MKILVTGAAGFLGTHLCRELRKRGHLVTGIDLMHGDYGNRCDIREMSQLGRIFARYKFDVVYHLAGEFGRKNGDDYYPQLWSTNVLGTRNVIEWCRATYAKLIFASSSEAYGSIADAAVLNENLLNTRVPIFGNEYALSKYTNEHQIQIARQHGLDAKVLRFFNAYGPGERYSPYRSVVCLFLHAFLCNQNPVCYRDYWRSFLYVDDWTGAVANVAERYSELRHDTYNIAGADYTSIEQLVEIIQKVIPESKSQPFWQSKDQFNVQNKRADISRAVSELGLKQSVSLEESVRRTADWMRENG